MYNILSKVTYNNESTVTQMELSLGRTVSQMELILGRGKYGTKHVNNVCTNMRSIVS